MEEEVLTIFKIWKKRFQQYLNSGGKGCKNV